MQSEKTPWYLRARRWGQTNLTEIDPVECDVSFWRAYWRRCRIQGVIVNAGGIVAYYPSAFPLQYRAKTLGERDLLGEFVWAARQEGLAVVARMDINRAARSFYDAHPDWFAVDKQGKPYRAAGRYVACVCGKYYKEYIPKVLQEIIQRYHPDGFTDNSWMGLSREQICYCPACQAAFHAATGYDLPAAPDYNDPIYRAFIQWGYTVRTDNWELYNQLTTALGGADCIWQGMLHAQFAGPQGCDLRAVASRCRILFTDHQNRDAKGGFEQNLLTGQALHGLAGWDKVVTESLAHYCRGALTFRRSAMPQNDVRLWAQCGLAGGIAPWYHFIGGRQEDTRMLDSSADLFAWHADNEDALFDREPLAQVGVVWSQANCDFYGRDQMADRVELPWRGMTRALTQARIDFVPVHIDDVDSQAARLDLLALPDIAAMDDRQLETVCAWVRRGKPILYTGATGTLDGEGQPRDRFPLDEAVGARRLGGGVAELTGAGGWDYAPAHSYLRLPEGDRHPIVQGFAGAAILPFGGTLHPLEAGRLQPVCTYIPPFPIFPPEFSYMDVPRTNQPAVLAGETPYGGRAVVFAADLDRLYGRTALPDQGDLLASAVLWALRGRLQVRVQGPGYLAAASYKQEGRLLTQLVNLSGTGAFPGFVEELYPVGPLALRYRLPAGFAPTAAALRVAGGEAELTVADGQAVVRIPQVKDHELLVLS